MEGQATMTTPKNLLIVGLCLVLIGLLVALLFRPAPKPEIVGNLTVDQENALKEGMLILEGENDSLRSALRKREEKDSIQKESHTKAVQPFKKVVTILEQDPEIIKLRDSIPKLDRLLKAKDSIIVKHEIRIAEMEHSKQVTKDINERVRANFEQRIAGTEQLLHDKEIENEGLVKENKKLRRRLALTKITGVIVLIGIGVLAL